MKDRSTTPAKDGARLRREKRLAEALRANLRRRKSAAGAKPAANPLDAIAGEPEKAPDSGKNED